MVCEKCERKLSKSAVPDVWKDGSRNAGAGQNGGKSLARNSYLESRSKGTGRFAPHSKLCRICKSKLSQDAEYCIQCAFAKAICAMCGVSVADLKFDKRGVEPMKKKKLEETQPEEVEADEQYTNLTKESEKHTLHQPRKKKKAKVEEKEKTQVAEEVVKNDAAGLALEAISVKTGQVKQATIGGEITITPTIAPSSGWMSALDAASGKTYYYNQTTGSTQWTDPRLSQLPAAPQPTDEWQSAMDASSGKSYLYNTKTGETKWSDGSQ